MATKVAINGFGRIGRLVARAILERPDCGLELVSINDLADAKANALLFKRDSVHGAFAGDVTTDGNDIIVNGKRIHVTAERDPANLPHAANGVEIALECTGFFADRDGGQKHIDAGAKRVLISAPAKECRQDNRLRCQSRSADSCRYDRLERQLHYQLPRAAGQGLPRSGRHRARADDHDPFAYTNDQKILDQIHSDPRRARAAAMNMIPDHHRRRARGGRGPARVKGQARRLVDPRANAQRLAWST